MIYTHRGLVKSSFEVYCRARRKLRPRGIAIGGHGVRAYGSARTGGGDAVGLPVGSHCCVAACERLLEQNTEK